MREALSDGPLTITGLGDALTKHPAYAHLGAVFDESDALTVSWLDERRRPDEAIEQEAARLAGILGTDLHVALAPSSAPAARWRPGLVKGTFRQGRPYPPLSRTRLRGSAAVAPEEVYRGMRAIADVVRNHLRQQ